MQTKKTLVSDGGEPLVYVNVSYPAFEHRKLKKTANPFYEELAKKFCAFAASSLLPRTKAAMGEKDFKPYSAVMIYNGEETPEYAAVTLQAFVFDGHNRADANIMRQKWDKKSGLMSKN